LAVVEGKEPHTKLDGTIQQCADGLQEAIAPSLSAHMQGELREALRYLDGNVHEPQRLLDTIGSLVKNSSLGEGKVKAILEKVQALVEVHKRAVAIQKEVKERFPDGLDQPEPFSESKQLLSLIQRPGGDVSDDYTFKLATALEASPVPRNVACELSRIAHTLWCLLKDEDADCMLRLATGEARQLASELRSLGRLHDAHTVEKLALDEGRSVSWKLQLELSHHKDSKMVELSKRIESLVTHAVLGQKQPPVLQSSQGSHSAASQLDVGGPTSRELQQQFKTTASGKVLALERIGPDDSWHVREVDGVACELICGALQEVYPHLSFAESMQHLETADYDFEAAANTLLHSSTPVASTTTFGSTATSGLAYKAPPNFIQADPVPEDLGEVLTTVLYAALLMLAFLVAHCLDSQAWMYLI